MKLFVVAQATFDSVVITQAVVLSNDNATWKEVYAKAAKSLNPRIATPLTPEELLDLPDDFEIAQVVIGRTSQMDVSLIEISSETLYLWLQEVG